MPDRQRLCVVAGGMDLPKMPWIWASSADRGEKELPACGKWSETCVHVCLGASLWVRHSPEWVRVSSTAPLACVPDKCSLQRDGPGLQPLCYLCASGSSRMWSEVPDDESSPEVVACPRGGVWWCAGAGVLQCSEASAES